MRKLGYDGGATDSVATMTRADGRK